MDNFTWSGSKLDGVGPVDNRPSTKKLHHFVKKNVTRDMGHGTWDMWHVTLDMRRVTCDMLWGVNILSKFQLPSSYGLWFMIFWILGGKGWLPQWINDKAGCKTDPATPSLLKRTRNFQRKRVVIYLGKGLELFPGKFSE